jgi:hypothetical protein
MNYEDSKQFSKQAVIQLWTETPGDLVDEDRIEEKIANDQTFTHKLPKGWS